MTPPGCPRPGRSCRCPTPPRPASSPLAEALLENEAVSQLPLAVLGNKVDRPDALGEEELAEALGLPDQVRCDC